MKPYKYRLNLENVEPIGIDRMTEIYNAMWLVNTSNGVSPSGYTKLKCGNAVFTSSNIYDPMLALKYKHWDISRKFNVTSGTTVYVIPTPSLSGYMGIKAVAVEPPYLINSGDESQWCSEYEETDGGIIIVFKKIPL